MKLNIDMPGSQTLCLSADNFTLFLLAHTHIPFRNLNYWLVLSHAKQKKCYLLFSTRSHEVSNVINQVTPCTLIHQVNTVKSGDSSCANVLTQEH